MRFYWPCAVMRNSKGEEERLFTYEAVTSLQKASDQIILWRDGYGFNIIKSWVDVYENGDRIMTIKGKE